MRNLILMMLLGALVLFAGCFFLSLHPFYTDKDLVFEPSLVGQWDGDNSKETWAFSKKRTNEYKLIYTDSKGKQGTFSAHLMKIKGNLFLDFFPEKSKLKGNDVYQFHLLPMHTFVYVKQIEPTLQMASPDSDWLENHLAANPGAIRHEKIKDDVILTARTEELQTFWLKHLNTENAFRDPLNMTRKRSATSVEQLKKPIEGNGSKPAP